MDILSFVGSPTLTVLLVLLGAATLCYIPGGVNGAMFAAFLRACGFGFKVSLVPFQNAKRTNAKVAQK